MSRRLLKISYNAKEKKVRVEWEEKRPGGTDERALACPDRPAPAFLLALTALRKHVAEICELDDDYCANMEIRGASFSYGGEQEVMGATITALKPLTTANAPLVLNTPHLPSDSYNETTPVEDVLTLSEEAIEALGELEVQAFKYLDGEREHQLELATGSAS